MAVLDLGSKRVPYGDKYEVVGWSIRANKHRSGKVVDLLDIGAENVGEFGDVLDLEALGLSRVHEMWTMVPVSIFPGGSTAALYAPLPAAGIVRLVGS